MTPLKLNRGLVFILTGALVAFKVQAGIVLGAQIPVYNPAAFQQAGGYVFNQLPLPAGTALGSAALEIDIPLSASITLTSLGTGYNYGFGVGGLNPGIPSPGEAFSFYIQLLNQGVAITPDFAELRAQPYAFGFTHNNPFPFGVDNLYVTTSTGVLAPVLTFDEIKIQVFNQSQRETITSFGVSLGVGRPALAAVPEPATVVAGAVLLLPVAASCWRGWRRPGRRNG